MARNSNNKSTKQDETDRYRRAAEDALQQLDWTIGYLHGIRKTNISKALASNRHYIRRSLMRKPSVEDPSVQTGETYSATAEQRDAMSTATTPRGRREPPRPTA